MIKTDAAHNAGLKLTNRGRYAVMALVELARQENDKPVPLADIAETGHISISYLEQLFAALRRHGLVHSYRGPGGGYVLAKPPEEIQIAEILQAAEDSLPARQARTEDSEAGYGNQQTYALWSQIGELLNIAMRKVSLNDVLKSKVRENPHMLKLFDSLT